MGCGGSKPVDPDAFLQPHAKDAPFLSDEPADERYLLAFLAGQTASPWAALMGGSTPPRQVAMTAHKFARGAATAVVENPDGASQVASAPLPRWSSPEPFLRLVGTAAPQPKRPELRLEVAAVDGTPLGLLLTKAKQDVQNAPAEMLVYSVAPRHAGQPPAVELSFSERSGAPEFVPTKTPLTMSNGAALYAWARVHDTKSLYSKLLVFNADAKGRLPMGKAAEASYVGRATAIAGKTMQWTRSDSPAGCGCAIVLPDALPNEALGLAPDIKGKPADVFALEVAAGVDPVLMVAFAVLWEKASLREHFDHTTSGGGG
jgi:hypothetical protein